MQRFDTGISKISREGLSLDKFQIQEHLKKKTAKDQEHNFNIGWTASFSNKPEQFKVRRIEDETAAFRIVTYHRKLDGSETHFDVIDESGGSQRLLDLLPAFLNISDPKSDKVFVIDDLDRSLHSLLTYELLEGYLGSCSEKTRSQLIFTAQDSFLIDQNLLRRDEMRAAERSYSGNTKFIYFSDYKDAKSDKDIRKSYLQGRLGGIPRIFLNKSFNQYLSQSNINEDNK